MTLFIIFNVIIEYVVPTNSFFFFYFIAHDEHCRHFFCITISNIKLVIKFKTKTKKHTKQNQSHLKVGLQSPQTVQLATYR